MKEKEIQTLIIQYLHKSRMGYFFTVDNKGTYDAKKGVFRRRSRNSMPAGVSDILGVRNDGVMVAIEVKRPSAKNRVSDAQAGFLRSIQEQGGRAGVAWDIESALVIVTGDLMQ